MDVTVDNESLIQPTTEKEVGPQGKEQENGIGESNARQRTDHFVQETGEKDVQNDASDQSRVDSTAFNETNGQTTENKETVGQEKEEDVKGESDAQQTMDHVVQDFHRGDVQKGTSSQSKVGANAESETNGQATANRKTVEKENRHDAKIESVAQLTMGHLAQDKRKEDVYNDANNQSKDRSKPGGETNVQATENKETVDQEKREDKSDSEAQPTTDHVVLERDENEAHNDASNLTRMNSKARSETNIQATANQETVGQEKGEMKSESDAQLNQGDNQGDINNDKSDKSKVDDNAESETNGQATTLNKEIVDKQKGEDVKSGSDTLLSAEREHLKEKTEDLLKKCDCDLTVANKGIVSKTEDVDDKRGSDTKHSEHKTSPKAAVQDEGVKTTSLDLSSDQSTDKATKLSTDIGDLEAQFSTANKMGDMSKEADDYNTLGRRYAMLGDLNQASEYHSLELQWAKMAKDRNREQRANRFLGIVYQNLGCFEQSIRYFKLALGIAKEEELIEKQRICYIHLSVVYQKLGDLKQLIECQRSLLQIAQATGNKSDEAGLACRLGIFYGDAGLYEKAIESHKLYLEIAQNVGTRANEMEAYSNLGSSFQELGNFVEAIDCHKSALDIAKEEGNREEEGRACGNLGICYQGLQDIKQAEWYHTVQHEIAKQMGDKEAEGWACGFLGLLNSMREDYEIALQYHELQLKLAKEVGDRAAEGRAYCDLGVAHENLGSYKQAISYGNLYLKITKETRDKVGEGRAYSSLGQAHHKLSDFKQALEYYKLYRDVAQDTGDRAGEGDAYCGLGTAYLDLGNLNEAIECHNLELKIAKELGRMTNEARAYCNLVNAYSSVGGFKKAQEYNELFLQIVQGLGDREGEARAYCNLGAIYLKLSDFNKSIECTQLYLEMATKVKNRDGVGRAYCHLGLAYAGLGYHPEAIMYHKKHLRITQQLGDKVSEGRAYTNLGNSYKSIGKISDAIESQIQALQIAKELDNRREEGVACYNLGNSYGYLLDFKRAADYFQTSLSISKEISDKSVEASAHGSLGNVLMNVGNFELALQHHKQNLALVQETGEQDREGLTHYFCGVCFEALGFLDEAMLSYHASVDIFNSLRELLQSKDEWKIGLRNHYWMSYHAIWNLLLKQDKFEEALCESEKGRAQALEDLLVEQYGYDTVNARTVDVCLEDICNLTPTTALYIAVGEGEINLWCIRRGERVYFWKGKGDFKHLQLKEVTDLESLVERTVRLISSPSKGRCEDRSLDGLDRDVPSSEEEKDNDTLIPTCDVVNKDDDARATKQQEDDVDILLRMLYDITIRPLVDRISGTDLILVPDGPLILAPFAALLDLNYRYLSESFTIRVVPSLYSLKLIVDAPQDYHCTNGALIVGDPYVKEIVKKDGRRVVQLLEQLPNAREEAIMIGSILNTTPLIGEKATKREVLKKLSAVALAHIAAHGRSETGEIALTPNPDRRSKIPVEDDYMLSMAEVLSVGLRAKLVVLSCCHSGRGSIKAEGVVGISRAFLGAGARSVLVSLWALNDESTLEFLRNFYQLLVHCKNPSKALNQAMKSMRESDAFKAEKYWAPFVLIGDDVSFDFQELQSVL